MTQRPELLLYLALVAATVALITGNIAGDAWLGFVGGLVGGATVTAPSAIRRSTGDDEATT